MAQNTQSGRDDGVSGDEAVLVLKGRWTLDEAQLRESELAAMIKPLSGRRVVLSLAEVAVIDVSGAWLLKRLERQLQAAGRELRYRDLSPEARELLKEVERHHPEAYAKPAAVSPFLKVLDATGRAALAVYEDALALVAMLGSIVQTLAAAIAHPRRFRPISIAVQFQNSCIGAVPIVMLMSFLIGAIIAQQGGFYLSQFGADIFVVDLAGVLVLREIGVILTAIMVAGRSGSAFTAELGSMKMREEVDALNVIGLRITEVLVVPRLVALMLAMPILVFLADLAALFGAALTCWAYLGIVPSSFIIQLQSAVNVETLTVGIIKAPFMALIIGLIACIEGLKVEGSAESLGKQTTSSVVKAIFMVIVVDGFFAIFFASVGL
ncbi:ABC transporter permease [Polycladidibacter hongkongensis]|uniref:ABC transporter permease n=1 Tax=Polycladidibacter hongkongensis TaxID=1647556 RepID=UPI0008298215|nr:ABC transporter permease [Pseudovibrio hongkongensis]